MTDTANNKLKELQQFLPESLSVSAQAYLKLVADKMKDKEGNYRPAEDLRLFLYQAKRTGLDPLAGQIHAIYRWNGQQRREVMSIQTSIDGFRLIAQRTAEYAGQDDVIYEELDGNLVSARACVYRINRTDGKRYPYPATAFWEEYKQTGKDGQLMGLWGKMPKVMLAKTAEALAMRKAFPQEMSGIYTGDEMAQHTNVDVEVVQDEPEEYVPEVEEPVAVKVSSEAPRMRPSGGMPTSADVSDWNPKDVRDVTIYVASLEKKTAKSNGNPYLELWTNYGAVKAWKNSAPQFEAGVGHYHKVALEASEYNGVMSFVVVRHYSMIANQEPEIEANAEEWDMEDIDKQMKAQ